MKRRYAGIILMLLFALILPACGSKEEPKEKTAKVKQASEESEDSVNGEAKGEALMQNIIIEVNGQSFPAEVFDNNTVRALTMRFPMSLSMDEMNGNEKFCYLNESLPADAMKVGSIQTGDILLYGSDCLVLFFEDFNTSYSYTRIGHIEDAEAFAKSLSRGTVTVSFRAGE